MDTQKADHHKKKANDIQLRVTKMALVIFFVATISAAGGFIRGEQLASQPSSTSQIAAAFKMEIPKIGSISFDNGTISHNIAGNVGKYTCNQGGCRGIANGKPVQVGCSGGKCTWSFDGETGSIEGDALAALQREMGKNNTPGNNDDNDAQNAPQHDPKKCDDPKTADEQCVNKCSTTYVKGQPPRVKDCGHTAGLRDNPIYKAIDELRVCIQRETGHKPQTKAEVIGSKTDQLDVAMCNVTDPSKVVEKGTQANESQLDQNDEIEGKGPEEIGKIAQTASEKGKLYVPSNCLPLLRKVEKAKKEGLEKGKAAGAVSEDSATKCTYHGVANCVYNATTKKYDCTTKEGAANNQQPPPGADQCTGNFAQQALCNTRQGIQNLGDTLRNALGSGLGGANGSIPGLGGGKKGGGGQPQNNNRCPEGYTQTTDGGRTVCTPEKKKDQTTPSCLLVSDKDSITEGEQVTLKWRTSNAEKVEINDVGDNIPKNSQKIVTPKETTTYTLKATGKGDDNMKECTTTVTVKEAETGTKGAQPPRLTCNPGVIQQGKAAHIKWACTTNAKTSKGTNIDTEGKLAGPQNGLQVRPTHNTQYSVTCLDENDKELGTSSCAVTVGQPLYDIVVHPKQAKRGDRVRVSWASLYMKSCRVTGPRGFDYARKQGVVITEPFALDKDRVPNKNIRAAIYSLECESLFGKEFTHDVEVKFVEG